MLGSAEIKRAGSFSPTLYFLGSDLSKWSTKTVPLKPPKNESSNPFSRIFETFDDAKNPGLIL